MHISNVYDTNCRNTLVNYIRTLYAVRCTTYSRLVLLQFSKSPRRSLNTIVGVLRWY